MSTQPVPLTQAVLGLTLFTSIALPLTPSGHSLLDMLVHLFADSPFAALTFLIMFASPQLFGLAVAVAHLLRDAPSARPVVVLPLAVLQAMTFLVAIGLTGTPRVVAPYAFMGFALVTSGYYLYASAEAEAAGRQLSLRWYIRWGALLVAGIGAWLRLQSTHGPGLGVAVDVATGAAVLLLASTARPRPPVA